MSEDVVEDGFTWAVGGVRFHMPEDHIARVPVSGPEEVRPDPVVGEQVLLLHQEHARLNGLWVYNGQSWVRSTPGDLYDESRLPTHLPMGLTSDGQGPADEPDIAFYACWCSNPDCAWSKAFEEARRLGANEGRKQVKDAVELYADQCRKTAWPVTSGGILRMLDEWVD